MQQKLPFTLLLLSISFLYVKAPLYGQLNEQENQIIELIYSEKFDFAERLMYESLEKDENNMFSLFNMARMRLSQLEKQKTKDRYHKKYIDYAPYFDWIIEAYEKTSKARDLYHSLPEEEKPYSIRHLPATHDEIDYQLMQTFEKEAYQLISGCLYRKPLSKLYGSNIYNRVTDVDTLETLRDSFFDQTTRFMETFTTSEYLPEVYNIRKELLQEYIQINDLRKYGDRSGSAYEKYCKEIQLLFGEEELHHVLPKFYGAEFNWGEEYMMSDNFQKLVMIAAQEFMSVRELLCKLNLHYGGVNEENSALYDQFIEAMAPTDIALVAVQKVAAPHVYADDAEKAIEVFNSYRKYFPENQAYFDKMVGLMNEKAPDLNVTNIGHGVNTISKEYQPVVTLDGETLYFARKTNDYGEDIFYTTKLPDGRWGAAEPITDNLNTKSHEIPLCISPDGNTFFIYGNYSVLPQFAYIRNHQKNLGKGDFYFSEHIGRGWGKIDVLPNPINTPNYEAGLSITADGNALLFCSDRKGAVGGYNPNYPEGKLYYHGSGEFNLDLYVSQKKEDGSWGDPVNLGEVINTPFAEKNPFMAPDMKTLYFSSDGHYGLGGYDIFMTKRLNEDSWTEWSEPENLGKALNSPYDDAIYISPNGENAFIVSNREEENYGKTDIYQIDLPLHARPEPMVIITGRIIGPDGNPLDVDVVWREMGKPENHGKIPTQKGTGKFTVALKPGKIYTYHPEKDEHFSSSSRIDLTKIDRGQIIKDNPIEIFPIKKLKEDHTPLVLRGLHFDFNSDKLRPESAPELERLSKLLNENPEYLISIEGHTDSKGNDEFNLDLSTRRAESVRTYLIERGLPEIRIRAKGYGEKHPIASNDTESGRAENRRVEFRIL